VPTSFENVSQNSDVNNAARSNVISSGIPCLKTFLKNIRANYLDVMSFLTRINSISLVNRSILIV
jgi:hypothetical protein